MAVGPQHWKGGIILEALPGAGACMMLDQLAEATGLPKERITRLVTALNRNGLITMARRGCYRRTEAGDRALATGTYKSGPKGPRRRPSRSTGLKDKIWAALRMLRKATVPELLEIVQADGLTDPDALANRYLRMLRKAGVTAPTTKRVAGTAMTSPGFPQHVLLRDLGPKAPIWKQASRRLFDPNSGRFVDELQTQGGGHV
jgi:hypothetical protein